MEYKMEELLPLVETLSQKYTSKESSSITYETARMLMEAVLYCINELFTLEEYKALPLKELPAPKEAYDLGYQAVITKVYKAKEFYESLLETFYDYGCRNPKDTIILGMPAFFLGYDPKFKPQDHILTLDYPTLRPITNLSGVDAIYAYLKNIRLEWEFLNAFPKEYVEYLLERVQKDYRNLFFDNIAEVVLLTALGCILAGKPYDRLELITEDMDVLNAYFYTDTPITAEEKIRDLISHLFVKDYENSKEIEEYFLFAARDYSVRILNGIKYNSLKRVFYLTDEI